MTPERWQRIGELFDRALQEPAAVRERFVRAATAPADVQEEVLTLVRAHETGGGFLEPASLLDSGAAVGPYRIISVIGRGGMGVVYLAEDSRLHRRVALKALPPHMVRDENFRARLRQEARAAAALSHPSIATVYALEEIDGQVFIAAEYLEGRTLRDVLAGGPLPIARAREVGASLADALAAAHARGIVHRDLKPENIVQLPNGAVKILDFGLAQIDTSAEEMAVVSRLTDSGTLAGTPLYMSPEQLLAQPTDARTDQFAFGVLLYELITGRLPFGGGSLPSTIARVLTGDPDVPTEMPDATWQVIRRCLQRSPGDRFATTRDLANALTGSADPSHLPDKSPLPDKPQLPDQHVAAEGNRKSLAVATGWWVTHQLVVSGAYWVMVWPAWHVHRWTGRYGVLTFLATLVAVIVAGNLRLHLWFTARTYPGELAALRGHVGRLVRAADFAFALIMMATGLVIADTHTGWSALLVSMGLGAAIAFLFIEPTTARAAFGRENDQ
ncbi:MAG: serine/threonine-protein kinase [Vicinamibacterales bacterium]